MPGSKSLLPPPAAEFPEEHLRRALQAEGPKHRLQEAEAGLAFDPEELAPDTQVLLLRQAYLAHVELRQLRRAVEVADAMAAVGPLKDFAYTDKARALQALGELHEAIEAQRLAARNAPPQRRSFHFWSLATLQHFVGDVEGAEASLKRGLRLAKRDRPLLKAHLAYVRLDAGLAVRELDVVLEDLAASPNGQGYGQYLLGMIAWTIGDRAKAALHLRAFLRRNASLDEAKRLTLREELRRARVALAKIESV
ncbi:MAG: tetratricopeptide repeat protein [Sandaracinus sp.]|nr:tetratricopeptide repeat protein [Sandaracinus sp.]MCB9633534.1 tetratricopeptide repeat protein [Sandaracinus sp.]